MKKTLIVALSALLLCGCKTALTSNNISSVTTWQMGLGVQATETSTGTAMPKCWLGVQRTTVTIIPTSTNQVYAPRFGSAYSGKQNAYDPIACDAQESVFSGDVMISTNATGSAVIPKLAPPVR